MGFNPVNPEAIAVFGLFATVICFGLEMLGVGVKGADHAKLTRTLGYVAIVFGGVTQLFTSVCMYLFGLAGDNSIYLGTIFAFFGFFWVLAGLFFLNGGDKKVMAHFFACGLLLCVVFTIVAFKRNLIWPLAVDLLFIDALLATLVVGWYTEKPIFTKIAGALNIIIGIVSLFLLFPQFGL